MFFRGMSHANAAWMRLGGHIYWSLLQMRHPIAARDCQGSGFDIRPRCSHSRMKLIEYPLIRLWSKTGKLNASTCFPLFTNNGHPKILRHARFGDKRKRLE